MFSANKEIDDRVSPNQLFKLTFALDVLIAFHEAQLMDVALADSLPLLVCTPASMSSEHDDMVEQRIWIRTEQGSGYDAG